MGLGLEIVAGSVTAPGAVFTAWTVSAGLSLQIRNGPFGKKIYMLSAWGSNQVAGVLRLRSPRLHDNVQGIRGQIPALATTGQASEIFAKGQLQPLIPQDVLIAEQTGSAVGGQIENGAFLTWYEELPGINARLIDDAQLDARTVNVFTVEIAITPAATPGFSGQRAINFSFDLFKANTDYALVGYLSSVECAAVRFTGIDTGNLGVGGPGLASPLGKMITAEWFDRLSRLSRLPTIPVFNSANKFGITVDVLSNQAATATNINAVMAELSPAA